MDSSVSTPPGHTVYSVSNISSFCGLLHCTDFACADFASVSLEDEFPVTVQNTVDEEPTTLDNADPSSQASTIQLNSVFSFYQRTRSISKFSSTPTCTPAKVASLYQYPQLVQVSFNKIYNTQRHQQGWHSFATQHRATSLCLPREPLAGSTLLSSCPSRAPRLSRKASLIVSALDKPYVCEVCSKRFKRREHLQRHGRIHTQEKPFLCEFCGRAASRNDNMKAHRM